MRLAVKTFPSTYAQALDLQQQLATRLVELREGTISAAAPSPEAYLLLGEHEHVYTLGRHADSHNMLLSEDRLAAFGARVHRISRGGDVTYHGPGQLVGYPIIDLKRRSFGPKDYVHGLEEVVITLMATYGLRGVRDPGAAGVWMEPIGEKPLRKVCALGVNIARGITTHGFALNVSTDLTYFSYINPCGFTDRGVTSLSEEVGWRIDLDEVKGIYARLFARHFQFDLCDE